MYQGNTTFNTEEIELHIRKYRSLLKSAGELKISQLIDSHRSVRSILHEKAETADIDIAAATYVLLRLPSCMSVIKTVILGQSYDVFEKGGYGNIKNWTEVEAPGRRRKMFFDGKSTLAVYIASVTDVDDMITLLTAFQIEWNKFHRALENSENIEEETEKIISAEDIGRIKKIWGKEYSKFLSAIKSRTIDIGVKLLSGSYVEYAKATRHWWHDVIRRLPLELKDRPVYFVSSNTHSLVNLLSRFSLGNEKVLIDFLYKSRNSDLIRLWEEIGRGDFLANRENFLYYIAKKYARTDSLFVKAKTEKEQKLGIHHIPASHFLDIDVQVIEIAKLANSQLNPALKAQSDKLKKSRAIIINVDYPLGWAAYQVLTEIGQNVANVRGIYIMGKAATLNGNIGDILIPTTVFDQHTHNIYVFQNALSSADFTGIFKTGMVLDNQKTVSAKGTFLENEKLIKHWYREGYTTIEMEAGPFLNAVYEFVYYDRYEENQFINLTNTPFEIGIAHYASDTPYSKAKNLGVRNLSYEGVEPTYAISLAILKKIISRED